MVQEKELEPVQDGQEPQDFKLVLAHKAFLHKISQDAAEKVALKQEITTEVFSRDAAPLYQHLCTELGWELDVTKLKAMQDTNQKALEELDAKLKDAEENLSDIEVRDVLLAKATYNVNIGDTAAAAAAYEQTDKKTAGSGIKMDFCFAQIRLAIFHGDWTEVKALMAKAQTLCDSGGDWERKNRLKVYRGVYCMAVRRFEEAAELLLDSTATFTTTELFDYEKCVYYAVLCALPSLERPLLKKSVVDSPEVLTVIHTMPSLEAFLNSFYDCRYGAFFQAFSQIADEVSLDLYLHPHSTHYVRELRVKAYVQFLESYKSVTITSMAEAFGVSPDFMDRELFGFIVDGRLTAKIDRVAGVVETNRADARNTLYHSALKQGDKLLNRIQKLSKVIDVI